METSGGEKMNRKIIGFTTVTIALFMMTIPVLAVPLKAAPYRNFPTQLYLFEKDAEWQVVDGGAWGKLNVDKGVFNGHGLEAGVSYSLYSEAEWGVTMEFMGSDVADSNGNVHIRSDVVATGKVWLVLTSDVTSDQMSAWNPTEYLFEYAVL